jgi:site-specific DNA-methyltransferase (adenine-specific)
MITRGERWTLLNQDCLEVMKRLPADRFDSCVTDPPYGLSEPPPMLDVLNCWIHGLPYRPETLRGGFMGKAWDAFVPGPEVWREVLRVLKPGAHLLTFGGSRTYDLIGVALRLAGFEIRDTLSWMYGTGFPKSLNLGDGRGTALKPAWEPIILARKPLTGTVAANVQQWGTGALNIDGCRVEGVKPERGAFDSNTRNNPILHTRSATASSPGATTDVGRWPANVLLDEHAAELLDEQTGVLMSGSMKAGVNAGRKSAVYSADARRPLATDIIGSTGGAARFFYVAKASRAERDAGCEALPTRSAGEATDRTDDTAGLSSPRAGAGRTGGARNIHPTVKPIALMRWLVRLVTPPGGTVLDPFTGSGSTGVAALQEGVSFVGVEREPEYIPIARARLEHAVQPSTAESDGLIAVARSTSPDYDARAAAATAHVRPLDPNDPEDLARWDRERGRALRLAGLFTITNSLPGETHADR